MRPAIPKCAALFCLHEHSELCRKKCDIVRMCSIVLPLSWLRVRQISIFCSTVCPDTHTHTVIHQGKWSEHIIECGRQTDTFGSIMQCSNSNNKISANENKKKKKVPEVVPQEKKVYTWAHAFCNIQWLLMLLKYGISINYNSIAMAETKIKKKNRFLVFFLSQKMS